jgi:hypothetical protein
MVPELIKKLDGYLPYQVVVPLFAEEFQPNGNEEERILSCSRYPEDFDPEVDDPIDFSCFELSNNFRQLRSDLSKKSRLLLRHLDKDLLQKFVDADSSLTCAIAVRLARECTSDDEESHLLNDALMLFNEAAEQGDPRAQWILAERFLKIKNGQAEAFRLLAMAALQRYEPALHRLTTIFKDRDIHGHPSAELKRLKFFAKAGVNEARFELSHKLYLAGHATEAFYWIMKSAESGDSKAQERLAFFYEIGEGCPKDKDKANYWKNLAAQGSSVENGEFNSDLEKQISTDITGQNDFAPENYFPLPTPEVDFANLASSSPIETSHEDFSSLEQAHTNEDTIEPENYSESSPNDIFAKLQVEEQINSNAQVAEVEVSPVEVNILEKNPTPIEAKHADPKPSQPANNTSAQAGLFTTIGSEITTVVGWVAKNLLNKFFRK